MKKMIILLVLMSGFISTVCFADECMEGDCESGVGTGFTEDGKIYQGHWEEGLPHGQGKVTVSKGKYIEGLWEKGVLITENETEGK